MTSITPGDCAAEPVSLEAYARLEEPDDLGVFEVVEGRLVREPRPGYRHGRLQARLARMLADHAEAHHLGVVLTDVGIVLSEVPATVRGPDVAFLARNRVPEGDPAGLLRVVPDLVVEIISPTDTARDLNARIVDFLDAGVPEAWVAEPDTRTVTVYRADGSGEILRGDEVLRGGAALPGFELEVEAVFEG